MKLADVRQDENLSICVLGDSGSGKTVFTSSFPKPMHILDFDGKSQSAANHLRRTNQLDELDGISVTNFLKVTGMGEGRGAKNALQMQSETFFMWLNEMEAIVRKNEKFPYKTIVIDSITRFSEMLLASIVQATIGKVKGPVEGQNDIPGLQHYMLNSTNFKSLINRFLALPCTKIVTAHYERDKDELTGRIVNQALLSGKLSPYLPIVFEEVYRSFVDSTPKGPVYKLQTLSDKDFNCRSQLGLPAVIESHYKNLKIS